MNQRFHLLISIFLIILLPATWDSIDPTARIVALSILLLVGASWLVVMLKARHSITLPKLILPLSIFVLLSLGLLFNAPVPVYSIYWGLSGLLLLLFFIFVIDSHNYGWKFRTWENAVIFVAVIMAAIDLFLVVAWYFTWWDISGIIFSSPPYSVRSPGGLLGHPNYIAGYMNLVIPFIVIRLFRASSISRRILWMAVLLLLLSVVFFTSSRGGWIALFCSLIGMASIFLVPKILASFKTNAAILDSRPRITKRSITIAIVGIFLLSIIVILAIPQIQRAAHGSIGGRFEIWENSIELIVASPWWGNSPGSYSFLYASLTDGLGRTYLMHAHNLILQTTSDMGFVGILLLVWAAILIAKRIIDRWKLSNPSTYKRDYLIAYCGMGIALLVHNQVDFLFYKFLISISVVIFTGLLFWGKIDTSKIKLSTKSLSFIVALGISIVVAGGGFIYWGMKNNSTMLEYAADSKWFEATQAICPNAEAYPAFTYNAFQCGLVNAVVSFTEHDESNLLAAVKYTRSGLEQDPYWFLHWANLGSYEWQLGNTNLAMGYFLKAIELDPYRDFLWLNLGILSEQLGKNHEAVVAYRRAMCLNPWYQESLIIIKSPLYEDAISLECEEEHLPDMTEKAHRLTLWQSYQAYLENDFDTSEKFVLQSLREQTRYPLAYAYLAQLNYGKGETDRAVSNIKTAIFISNTDPNVLFIAGKLYREYGNDALGYEYLTNSFKAFRNRRDSNRYYADAYRQYSLPLGMSPYLYTGDISEEKADLFMDLVVYLKGNGNFKLAGDIENWLDWNRTARNHEP